MSDGRPMFEADSVRAILERHIEVRFHGDKGAFARAVGVTARQIDFILKGHRFPRGSVLAALNLERVDAYRVIEGGSVNP